MKQLILILIIFLKASLVFGQNLAYIKDINKVKYNPDYEHPELDSIVWIVNDNRWTEPWQVYYDSNFKILAYESHIDRDTCKITEYWRNRNIKMLILYINGPNDNPKNGDTPLWYYQELYCKNGQMISKEFPNEINEQLIIEYYCNGQLKLKFLRKGIGAVGKMETWYETGMRKNESFWKDHKEEGEWKYYKPSGELDYEENYANGKLINTTKKK
ncbi:MAG: hypothetical protein ABI723_01265 [Bacteroidia bacterium]